MADELFHRLAQRYTEFMVLINEFLPEYSDLNPVHPPHMYWTQISDLFRLLRRDGAQIPITHAFLEEHRDFILDVVTEYNRDLRADMTQMAFEHPLRPIKPIAITEEKALEILKSASTLFVKMDQFTGLRTSTFCTYDGLIEHIRKEFHYDEFDVRLQYGGYSSYGWPPVLLKKLGLDENVTWDVVEAKQAEKPLVCLCGKPGFKQPVSFIELVSPMLHPGLRTVTDFCLCDSFPTCWRNQIGTWISRWLRVTFWHFRSTRVLILFGSPDPTRRQFDYDHNTTNLSKLKKTIVQLDPENGPSLDTLLEKYRQKLSKRA